ncbi:hypothetical protein GGR57DRAFT_112817 [Xylariaceae sp. FL1272]|nr:hypothetical protein GGR57DRAFT_112817 [Xylariaceae sp. FL1272]
MTRRLFISLLLYELLFYCIVIVIVHCLSNQLDLGDLSKLQYPSVQNRALQVPESATTVILGDPLLSTAQLARGSRPGCRPMGLARSRRPPVALLHAGLRALPHATPHFHSLVWSRKSPFCSGKTQTMVPDEPE